MLSELLPEDKRRLHELELQLIEIEKGNPLIHVSDVQLGLSEMNSRLDELERIASRESKSHRDDYLRRVQHLRTSYNHIKTSLESIAKRKNISTLDMNRRELFGDIEGGRAAVTDADVAEHSSLSQSERMIREYIAIGQSTLGELVSQRDRLKGVQRKVLDIMNYLGLSSSLMKAIEGRDSTDRLLVFGGMAIVLLLLGLIWYFR